MLRKKHPGVWWLQTRSLNNNIFWLRAHRFCLFWEKNTLGFGGYRHADLIPISFYWEPIGSADCEKKAPWGFGGYRHAHLKPISFNWEPIGSSYSEKKTPWGLVVTETLSWYQYILNESPLVLLILRKKHPGVWWLQTHSLDTNIF